MSAAAIADVAPKPAATGTDVPAPAVGVRHETVLDAIAAATRERMADLRATIDVAALEDEARRRADAERQAAGGTFPFPFERALAQPGLSFICEVKRASPSKGMIARDFDPVETARAYERAHAAAISCLTEPYWFKGRDEHLAAVASAVSIPVLRKDFVVDDLMIYQAKTLGAAAVLLIVRLLSDDELAHDVALCHELGLSALVEAYDPAEVPRACAAGARIVGVNNRDLATFQVDFGRSIEQRPLVGPDRLFVSESGVRTADDIARLSRAGVDAVLIGETLMRAGDPERALEQLRSAS